jgi:RNA-directed DNA polymerase
MSNTSESKKVSAALPLTDWSEIPWIKLERYVWKLQQRIYHAESLGNKRKVRELQRLLMRSKASLLLSIRKVTQINKGKRTAGVDGYKALTPKKRTELYNKISTYNIYAHNPKPTRRTHIPKANGKKLRPLGIPVIIDRVFQNVAKLALEPQWEFHFESTSYGFRPKRSAHDAVASIFIRAHGATKKRWIFEGDFEGCFDNLDHGHILSSISNFPAKKTVKGWLKSGFLDNDTFTMTESGTPQGGIISPLLANIALHGMEEELGIKYKIYGKKNPEIHNISSKSLVRYADDFVVLCETREEAENLYDELVPYLEKRGLKLAEDKTRVTHITEGFDFLGFNFRHYPTNKEKGRPWKLFIRPSTKSQTKYKNKIKTIFEKNKGENVANLIRELNPVIRGTANYWKVSNAKEMFKRYDNYIFWKTLKHLNRLHRNKSSKWRKKRYFKPDIYGQSKDQWLLTDPTRKYQLRRMSWTEVKPHKMIKFKNSPYDKKLEKYYEERDNKQFERDNVGLRQKLAKKQKFECLLCGSQLLKEEELEIHHKIPKYHNGDNKLKNLSLVHISCHTRWHKVFPAKAELPTYIQFKAFRKMLRKTRISERVT